MATPAFSKWDETAPSLSEVMVNGPDDVYVERKGQIERVGRRGRPESDSVAA
jgi:Flp pilus assembly CpaF family ATPase